MDEYEGLLRVVDKLRKLNLNGMATIVLAAAVDLKNLRAAQRLGLHPIRSGENRNERRALLNGKGD